MFARSVRLGRMSRPSRAAVQRTTAIQQHMMSSSTATSDEAQVLFKSDGCLRTYILNRPKKLNALDESMIDTIRPKIEEWNKGELPGIVVGTGVGRAFCSGGDVESVIKHARHPDTLPKAIEFFRKEFELDYILAAMPKPYVAIMDGITMGGGVGLAVNAPFRIATENTVFAMPETKIGYCPDVGASYFLSKVDGEIGTYLALTAERLQGRAVFEHGFATHFVPARRIPGLLERLASLTNPTYQQIDGMIEEHRSERQPDEHSTIFVGARRVALDSAFRHDTVNEIVTELKAMSEGHEHDDVRQWAKETLNILALRSPTSLKVALAAIRRGKKLSLLEALQMELNIATAFCHGASPDFRTGVTAVLIEKNKTRPAWSPNSLEEVQDEFITREFFSTYSPAEGTSPKLSPPSFLLSTSKLETPMKFALPSEEEIGQMVDGSHPSSGSTVLTLEELLGKFDDMKKGKSGVRQKIIEVVERKCTTEEDKHLDKKWLKWKH
ncbi:hypothetical protein AcW1_006038 [Taiwanofungus camphoratus]|nr:hypothetical protein AcW1_006038 [Antrodia cinnamomea]